MSGKWLERRDCDAHTSKKQKTNSFNLDVETSFDLQINQTMFTVSVMVLTSPVQFILLTAVKIPLNHHYWFVIDPACWQ